MIIREEFDTLITQLLQCWHQGRHDSTEEIKKVYSEAMEHWHYGLMSHAQLLHFLEDVRERVMYRHCQEDYEAMASPHLLDDRDDSEHLNKAIQRGGWSSDIAE